MARRYTQEQLGHVLVRAHATSWQEVLDYLAATDRRPSGLSHDQLAELQDDLLKIADRTERFTPDAAAVYALLGASQPTTTTIRPGPPTPQAAAR